MSDNAAPSDVTAPHTPHKPHIAPGILNPSIMILFNASSKSISPPAFLNATSKHAPSKI